MTLKGTATAPASILRQIMCHNALSKLLPPPSVLPVQKGRPKLYSICMTGFLIGLCVYQARNHSTLGHLWVMLYCGWSSRAFLLVQENTKAVRCVYGRSCAQTDVLHDVTLVIP